MSTTLETVLLAAVEHSPISNSILFAAAQSPPISHEDVVGRMKALLVDDFVKGEKRSVKSIELTEEGEGVVEKGSQEALVYAHVSSNPGCTKGDLDKALGKDVVKVGMGNCMKLRWVKKDGEGLVAAVDSVVDAAKDQLAKIKSTVNPSNSLINDDNSNCLDDKDIKILVKRKLCKRVETVYWVVSRGGGWMKERKKKAADLTKEMLDSGSWETSSFRSYNFQTVGEKVGGGYLHPLLKVRAEFRKILMQMGFNEMPTNKWVESR